MRQFRVSVVKSSLCRLLTVGDEAWTGWWFRSAAFSCAFACGAMVVGPGLWVSRSRTPSSGSARTSSTSSATTINPPCTTRGRVPRIQRAGGPHGRHRRRRMPARRCRRSAAFPKVPVPSAESSGGASRECRPRGRRRRGAAQHCRWAVIESAGRAVGSDHPQHRHPQGHLPPRVRQARPCRSSCRPRCDRELGGVPLAVPPPSPPVPEGRPAPAGPPAPAPAPRTKNPLAPNNSGGERIPDSFRVGYAEYLRAATTTDLFVAALPGVAGIAGFTLARRICGIPPGQSRAGGAAAPRAHAHSAVTTR